MIKIISIIVGVIIVAILLSRERRGKVSDICTTTLDQTIRKNTNKEKVLTLLKEEGSTLAQGSSEVKGLSNSDIREALKVSPATAVRYMDELEREGKVEQIGATGHAVTYRLK